MFRITAFLSVLFICGVALAAPTSADLKRLEQQLAQERKAGLEAQKKASELTQEMKTVQQKIVGSAQHVQKQEAELSSLEEQLEQLTLKKEELSQKISLTDAQIGEFALGLQSLALRPRESLFFKPMTPIETVRSHALMLHSVPVLGTLNAEARKDLQQLLETQSELRQQAEEIKSATEKLTQQQEHMEKLLQQKAVLHARYQATHKQAQKKAENLASQAKDLKDLLAKLEAERKRQLAEKKRKEKERLAALEKKRKLAEKQGKRTPPPYTPPKNVAKGAFKKSYGSLLWPARGRITQQFGSTTVSGAHIKGLSIQTRARAQVVSPFDGAVLFSGPFKNYGHLMIIDNGDSYLTLLAGMEKSYVSVGQEILAGEAVGIMPSKKPSLYIEIRKDGTAINPRPWFPRM